MMEKTLPDSTNGIVAALAGRRIDDADTTPPRFPLNQVQSVRHSISQLYVLDNIKQIVCSAACGSDLLALEEANRLGVKFKIILPFGVDEFRKTSVVDRPGKWGELYDKIILIAKDRGDLILLEGVVGEDSSYSRVTAFIIGKAIALAQDRPAIAISVWEGQSRGSGDATEEFRTLSIAAGMHQRSVLTCSN